MNWAFLISREFIAEEKDCEKANSVGDRLESHCAALCRFVPLCAALCRIVPLCAALCLVPLLLMMCVRDVSGDIPAYGSDCLLILLSKE